MCGIAGIVALRAESSLPPSQLLQRLCADMRQRGPDAGGQWSSPDGRVQLGHRRLSILDLSATGNQPMVDEATGCALVFNGEIYNFRELRKQLRTAGHAFRSDGDTEVLLRGYVQWGEGLLLRLRGMYAFGLWDPRQRALWLVRDPYGIKPLYYTGSGGCLTFASQVRPLRDHAQVDLHPDPAGIVGLLLLGSVPEPFTCYRNIRVLPAGHAMWVSAAGGTEPKGYASVTDVWRQAALAPEVLRESALNDRVRAPMRASVSAHQVADVPVGAFLSAGIDSGSLVGLMAEERTQPLRTVTLGFNSFRATAQDETVQAEQLAERYGTQHETIWISDRSAEADLPRALADMDQPSIDGFNTWLVSKHTAALGLKVVVSGVGGDELFGGYSHFSDLPRWHRRLKTLAAFPAALSSLSAVARLAHHFGLVHAKAVGLARLGPDLPGLYLVRRGLFMPWELPQVLNGDLVREGLAALQPPQYLQRALGGGLGNDYATIAALEASFYLRNQLLRDSDWASMAHSLELRTPLVDFQLLRELAPVLVQRDAGLSGKRPLALAPNPVLSDQVIDRPKSGFALPMDRWVDRSEALTHWRGHRHLNRPSVPWARRMAYSLLARQLPDAVLR